MPKLIDKIRKTIPTDFFTANEVEALWVGGSDSRKSSMRRALANGDILRLKKGVYILGPKYRRKPVSVHELARLVYSPSYVSFESALSYHGAIPERVSIVACATTQRSVQFQTPLGVFQYSRIPASPFLDGVVRAITSDGGAFLIASLERSLVDLIYDRKLVWCGLGLLTEGYRLDEEALLRMNIDDLVHFATLFRRPRVAIFVSHLVEEIRRVR